MKSKILYGALIFLLCLVSNLPMAKAQDDDDQFTVKLLPITPQIEAAATNAMQGCQPQKGKTTGEINKNGIYTLTGDLFHNGRFYAVVDDNDDVILCEWKEPTWQPISAINVHTVWNFPDGYRAPVTERGSDDQPRPFWMLDLQNRPLLVIASWVEKEGQNFFVILFDSKCERILDTDSSFGLPPVIRSQYLLTGDSSRVKSEWQATYFSEIHNDKFVMTKSWESSQPWHAEEQENQQDDSSNYASSNGKGYLILPDNRGGKDPADYLIFRSDPTGNTSVGDRIDGAKGKPFAAIYFKPVADNDGGDELEYLFEKLTGLPRTLYPDYDRSGTKQESAPKWKIKVTGSDRAIITLLLPHPAG